ncbi:MAG: methyltransferase RsmF C-terminal domain-like protein [Bacteroidales bacterium]
MFPDGFIKRIRTQEYINPERLLESLNSPTPVSIRLNHLKWNKVPSGSDSVPWCRTGYYISGRPSFTADPLFHAGCYYSQEASGMFLEVIFNRFFSGNNNLRVLDLCGAPGSKSTHLSSLIGECGCLISNEVIKSRVTVLAENITKWGIPNTIITNNDPSELSSLVGYFDLIVIDAPCSGEGMFRNLNTRQSWSENNADLCSRRQKRILLDIWPALKENGILVYSTCTFNPAENEKNIKWLTDKTLSECLKIDISPFPCITEISFKGITGYAFYPYSVKGDGFFISVIRKKESTGAFKRKKYGNIRPVTKEELKDAEVITGKTGNNFYKINDMVFHIPLEANEFLTLHNLLKIIKPGTELFKKVKDEIIPNHNLAVSLLLKKDIYPVIELSYNHAVDFLKKDNFNFPYTEKGWYIAVYKNCNLGFLRSTGMRFNNHYPVHWRIKMSREEIYGKQILKWND